jgi:alkylation response protein AidB-like acyl-CoA dehydrogenase
MTFGDDPREAGFRAEARAWLAEKVGPFRLDVDADSPSIVFADAADPARLERGRAWQRALHAAGWAGLAWPVEHGGRDLPVPLQAVWADELSGAGAPPPADPLGEPVVGPTILAHGSAEQQRRFLPPILTAEEIWCQLFSEPEAGSDLAAVVTTATRQGDGWVVHGHKIWSSGAHHADRGLLLARTDWDLPKHKGCTAFLLDMRQPGVTVRPVRQMTGGAAFDEVLLDGARLTEDDRLGAEGAGWAVAMTTLAHERLRLGLGLARVSGSVERLLGELRPRGVADDPIVRQLAARLVVESRCARYLGWRMLSRLSAGEPPGPDAAVAKLASGRVSRRFDELAEAMRGAGSMVVDEYTRLQLWAPATRIGGGTDEVLKDVIAERVLGLPPESRTDRTVPFRAVRNG